MNAPDVGQVTAIEKHAARQHPGTVEAEAPVVRTWTRHLNWKIDLLYLGALYPRTECPGAGEA